MALKTSVLSLEEQAKTGFTHKSVLTYSDIATLGGANTAVTISLLPYTAGTAFQAAAYKIVGTGFVGPSITNLTVIVGWNGATTDDDNGLIEASEIATAGTEVLYLLGNGEAFATKKSGYVALDAGSIQAVFTATGANLNVLTEGEIHIYLKAVDLKQY
jgi:hypothetical protein